MKRAIGIVVCGLLGLAAWLVPQVCRAQGSATPAQPASAKPAWAGPTDPLKPEAWIVVADEMIDQIRGPQQQAQASVELGRVLARAKMLDMARRNYARLDKACATDTADAWRQNEYAAIVTPQAQVGDYDGALAAAGALVKPGYIIQGYRQAADVMAADPVVEPARIKGVLELAQRQVTKIRDEQTLDEAEADLTRICLDAKDFAGAIEWAVKIRRSRAAVAAAMTAIVERADAQWPWEKVLAGASADDAAAVKLEVIARLAKGKPADLAYARKLAEPLPEGLSRVCALAAVMGGLASAGDKAAAEMLPQVIALADRLPTAEQKTRGYTAIAAAGAAGQAEAIKRAQLALANVSGDAKSALAAELAEVARRGNDPAGARAIAAEIDDPIRAAQEYIVLAWQAVRDRQNEPARTALMLARSQVGKVAEMRQKALLAGDLAGMYVAAGDADVGLRLQRLLDSPSDKVAMLTRAGELAYVLGQEKIARQALAAAAAAYSQTPLPERLSLVGELGRVWDLDSDPAGVVEWIGGLEHGQRLYAVLGAAMGRVQAGQPLTAALATPTGGTVSIAAPKPATSSAPAVDVGQASKPVQALGRPDSLGRLSYVGQAFSLSMHSVDWTA